MSAYASRIGCCTRDARHITVDSLVGLVTMPHRGVPMKRRH